MASRCKTAQINIFSFCLQRLSTSGMWANAMLPVLLELSVTCKEQASPDHGWWAAKPRLWIVGSQLAGCGLKHRHRKWANTKPCVCLRNKSLWEVRISSPSPTRYPKALAGQNPWLASAQGRQPCTPCITHRLLSGSATIRCDTKASPD